MKDLGVEPSPHGSSRVGFDYSDSDELGYFHIGRYVKGATAFRDCLCMGLHQKEGSDGKRRGHDVEAKHIMGMNLMNGTGH